MFSLVEAAELLHARQLSPVELTTQCLRRIGELNPRLNAFVTVTTDLAMEGAAKAEAEIAAGNWRGPLHGIPIALKDNIDVAGVLTSAGSRQYAKRIAQTDSDIATALKTAGAVIVGKANMHEFAFGGSGIVSAYGPARNPWDTDRITGGSSSGSAAAVAAGMCVAAIGTDTAGSVRCPAALCGVVGHRPSQGWFSNAGVVPLSPSLDTCGPITRSVKDAALMIDALAPVGYPPSLRFTAEVDRPIAGLKVATARNLAANADADVARVFEAAVRTIAGLGATLVDIEVEWDPPALIRRFEIYSYHKQMLADSPDLYEPSTLERVAATKGADEQQYISARRAMEDRLRNLRTFETCDAVLSPTAGVVAPKLAELAALEFRALREYEMERLLCNTLPFSMLWCPSVSVPCRADDAGLPVGLQISAAPGADAVALTLARGFERETFGSGPPVPFDKEVGERAR